MVLALLASLALVGPILTHTYITPRTFDCSIRYGLLLEVLDALAGDVAHRHVGFNRRVVVTASVEGMQAARHIDVNHSLRLHAYITTVGRSSMEVAIDHITVHSDGSESKIGTVQFVMVAKDRETGKTSNVPPLLLGRHDECPWAKLVAQAHDDGEARKHARRQRALESLSIAPPKPSEVELVHALHIDAERLKREKNQVLTIPLYALLASPKLCATPQRYFYFEVHLYSLCSDAHGSQTTLALNSYFAFVFDEDYAGCFPFDGNGEMDVID